MKTSFLSVMALLCFSCTEKIYDSAVCNDLSMEKFKGIPHASREFDDNCQGVDIEYTQLRCQRAFNFIARERDIEKVKAYYGEEVLGCLTNDDLLRFKN